MSQKLAGPEVHAEPGQASRFWSHDALRQLSKKSRKEWIAMARRDPNLVEVKSLRGHPRFKNPALPRGQNIINIHFASHKKVCLHLLKEKLDRLGWTEQYARKLKFIK